VVLHPRVGYHGTIAHFIILVHPSDALDPFKLRQCSPIQAVVAV
jgi:hypothetical protein